MTLINCKRYTEQWEYNTTMIWIQKPFENIFESLKMKNPSVRLSKDTEII